jgi:hypothetical protein
MRLLVEDMTGGASQSAVEEARQRLDAVMRAASGAPPAPGPPQAGDNIFVPDSLSFIGFTIFLVLCMGVTLDTCDGDGGDWQDLPIFQVVSLLAGVVAYCLAFLEVDAFGINAAWHVAIMAVSFVAGTRHLALKGELSRKTSNAIMAFSVLPLLTVIFSKAEAIRTTSCKLVSIISLSIAFLPVAISFRMLKRSTAETSRARRRLAGLLFFFWMYVCFIFEETLCNKKWSASKTQTFNLLFDMATAFTVCDLVWSLR